VHSDNSPVNFLGHVDRTIHWWISAQAWWQPITIQRWTFWSLPCAQNNSAVNFKRGDNQLQDNSAVNFLPSEVTNRDRTIQRWIFSVCNLIFWHASSEITLVFHSPNTNFLSDLSKNYFLEAQFSGEFRFSMPVSRSLGNSPNDSNSPLTFSSVQHRYDGVQNCYLLLLKEYITDGASVHMSAWMHTLQWWGWHYTGRTQS